MTDKQQQQQHQDHQDTGRQQAPGEVQADGKKKTLDSNSPRTRNPAEQVKVWEEEGGSPPQQISSTKSVKPRTESKAGSMGPGKD